jgi:type IV pilus assembly protein PilC
MVLTSINEGKTLTNALARTGNYFPPSDIAIIKAGETSGNLVPVLRNLAKEYAFINTLTSKFIGAVTYPVVLLVIAIVAVIVLFV